MEIKSELQAIAWEKIYGIALAEGTWNGVFYPYEEIAKAADSLVGKPIKVDHGKGVMSRVGIVESVSLDKANKRLYFKGKILDLEVYKRIQAKLITGVSVGVNAQILDEEASDLEFEEVSLVENPACFSCKLLEKQKGGERKMDEIEKLELDLDQDLNLDLGEVKEVDLDLYSDIEKALKEAGLEDDVVKKVIAVVKKFVKSPYPKEKVEESKSKLAVSDADLEAMKSAVGKIMGIVGKAKAAEMKDEDIGKLKEAIGELNTAAKELSSTEESLAVRESDLSRLTSFVKKLADRLAKMEAAKVNKKDVDKIEDDVKHAAEKVDALKSHLKEELEKVSGDSGDISKAIEALKLQAEEGTEKTDKEIVELEKKIKELDETPVVKSLDSGSVESKELHFGDLICGSQ